MESNRQLPQFASEAEEAAWYFAHREELDEYFVPTGFKNIHDLLASHDLVLDENALTVHLSDSELALIKARAAQSGIEREEYVERVLRSALETPRAA